MSSDKDEHPKKTACSIRVRESGSSPVPIVVKAAQSCGVSQPTLSTLINKLEEELDTVIFDRSAHPIRPTEIGEQIINQAKVVLYNISQLKELSLSEREQNSGRLRLGVIPTIAPYILPKLFQEMRTSQPQIDLQVSEQQTHIIVEKLRKAELDMAILATPLNYDDILEIPLYYEKFLAYISPQESIYQDRKKKGSNRLHGCKW